MLRKYGPKKKSEPTILRVAKNDHQISRKQRKYIWTNQLSGHHIRNEVQNMSIVEKDVSFNSVWLKKTEVIFHLINYLNYTVKT